jgi:hypothetical protein
MLGRETDQDQRWGWRRPHRSIPNNLYHVIVPMEAVPLLPEPIARAVLTSMLESSQTSDNSSRTTATSFQQSATSDGLKGNKPVH